MTSLWLLVFGGVLGAIGVTNIAGTIIVAFIVLSLPLGLLVIPVFEYYYFGSQYWYQLSFAFPVLISWSICALLTYIQWFKFGFSKNITFSRMSVAVGSVLGFLSLLVCAILSPVY